MKKDVRLVWRYLAVWVGLLLFKDYCMVVGIDRLLHPVPPVYTGQGGPTPSLIADIVAEWPMFMMFFMYVCPLLFGYIVATVLKADSPIDERSLWRTRPVAGRAMLRAKLLFLGLFGVLVPGVIETAVRLYYGFDAHECIRGFVETAVLQSAWMSIIVSAALLFKRTFTGLLAFVAIAISGGLLAEYTAQHLARYLPIAYYLLFTSPGAVNLSHPGYSFGIGFGFIFLTLEVAAVLAVAWLMYGGTRQWRGGAVLAIGLLLALGVTLAALRLFLSTKEPMPPLDNSIHLALHTLPATPLPDDPSEFLPTANGSVITSDTIMVAADKYSDSHQSIYGWLSDRSFPTLKDEVVRVTQVHSSLSWPDTKDRPLTMNFDNLSWNNHVINISAAVAAAGYGRLAWLPAPNFTNFLPLTYLMDKNALLTRKMIERAQTEPATWTGTLACEAGHLVTVADVPPNVGVSWSQVNNVSVNWSEGNFRYAVKFVGAYTISKKDHTQGFGLFISVISPAEYLLAQPPPNDDSIRIFLLYNPLAKECIESEWIGSWDRRGPIFSVLNAAERDVSFDFSDKRDENGQPLPTQMSRADVNKWLADAHLVELRYEPDRKFSCAVTIDPFLVPKQAAPAPAKK